MRAHLLLALVLVVGCGSASTSAPPTTPDPTTASPADPAVGTTPADPSPAAASSVTVQMTAATLGDDCGGAPPLSPPPAPGQKGAAKAKGDAKTDEAGTSHSKSKRRCDQTSIQLSIVAPAGSTPATIQVKEVEIFDDAGASLGVVKASAPRKWAGDEGYVDWDQTVAPGTELAVSYALSEPDWSKVEGRFDKTYVIKAKVSVDGKDQAVGTKVEVRASPPSMVKT